MLENPSALLCFDFDGTLVDETPNWEATQELLGVLRGLRESGAAWVVNTGRSLAHAMDGLTLHGINELPDFLIAREGEIYALDAAGRWEDVGEWNQKMHRETRRFVKAHLKFFRQLRAWLREYTKAQWIAEPEEPAGIVASSWEEMDAICSWIDAEKPKWPELDYQRASIYLRFSLTTYNKGTALTELGRVYSVPVSHRFVIGDGHNDLPMLKPEIAACIACPGNAVHEVKAQVHEAGGYRADAASTRGCLEALEFYFFD